MAKPQKDPRKAVAEAQRIKLPAKTRAASTARDTSGRFQASKPS